jgi:hypothetical protein
MMVVLAFSMNTLADKVVLLDGISAEAEIVDTSGCNVTIKRNDNTVLIEKKKIDYVVWKADTLSFKGYTCSEAPKRAVNVRETPEYKLMALFDNAPIVDQAIKTPAKMAFLIIPLESNTDVKEFVGVISPLFDSLCKKVKVGKIAASALYNEIEMAQPRYDYVFISRMFIEEINVPSKSLLSKALYPARGSSLSPFPQQKKSILVTSAIFMIYDCKLKKIVFREEYKEKRSVWGEDRRSLVNALTPDAWEKEWEDRQKQRKLSKNVQGIKMKVERDLGRYLAQ